MDKTSLVSGGRLKTPLEQTDGSKTVHGFHQHIWRNLRTIYYCTLTPLEYIFKIQVIAVSYEFVSISLCSSKKAEMLLKAKKSLMVKLVQCVQKVTVHLSLSALFLVNQRFSFLVFRL